MGTKIKRIAICGVQVPFIFGGAELLEQSLARELNHRGYQATVVRIPFKWNPVSEVISSALPWRLMDLTESNGEKIDLIVCTKYPTYVLPHPRKVLWLFHQHRQAYDWIGTSFTEFGEKDQATLQAIREIDNRFIPECKPLFTISKNVSARLKRYNGIESLPLYPPPPMVPAFSNHSQYESFILYVGRLSESKRPHLLVEAMRHVKAEVKCVIVGKADTAAYQSRLSETIRAVNGNHRVEVRGFVDNAELQRLYSNALAVFNGPVDEDYGFVTIEALLAKRPVITTTDAGGTLEFVTHGDTGFVTKPDALEIGGVINLLADDRHLAQRIGTQGFESVRAKDISWDNVIHTLVGGQ